MEKGPSGHNVAGAIAISSLCLSYSVPLCATILLSIYFMLNGSTNVQKAISVESEGTKCKAEAAITQTSTEGVGDNWSYLPSSCLPMRRAPCSPVRLVMGNLQELEVKILSCPAFSCSKDQDTENSPGFEGSMKGHLGRVLSHRCPSWLKNSCWHVPGNLFC